MRKFLFAGLVMVIAIAGCSDDKPTESEDSGFHPIVAGTPWQAYQDGSPVGGYYEFYPSDSFAVYSTPGTIGAAGVFSIDGNLLALVRDETGVTLDYPQGFSPGDTLVVRFTISGDGRQMFWSWLNVTDSLYLDFETTRPDGW